MTPLVLGPYYPGTDLWTGALPREGGLSLLTRKERSFSGTWGVPGGTRCQVGQGEKTQGMSDLSEKTEE